MNFTFVWIMDKLGFIPKVEVKVEKKRKTPAKKVAAKAPRKRRLG